MTIHTLTQRAITTCGGVATEVRNLIADRLGVAADRVSDDAHFADDLGADWLDRLELMIAIEDQFSGVEIADEMRIVAAPRTCTHLRAERQGQTREDSTFPNPLMLR